MSIHAACPACATAYTLDDDKAGKKVACARCQTVFRLPGGNPARTAETDDRELPAPEPTPGPSEAVRPYRRPADDWDDDREEDRPRRRRRSRRDDDYERDHYRESRRGFRCPYCGCRSAPYTYHRVSAGGWVTFVVLLLFCLPLFWIGLLITEPYRVCCDCGIKLG